MRLQAGLVPLLASHAIALPHSSRLSIRENKCSIPFDVEHTIEERKNAWEKSGAGDWLSKFIDDKGLSGWSAKMFRETMDNGGQGGQGGARVNCDAMDSTTCKGAEPCGTYDPPEAFFVHQSLGNLYSQLNRLHENMQDEAIDALTKGIDEVLDTFGPPPEPDDWMYAIIIGAFVGGAALAGPVWQVAAPMTAMVSVFNIAAGVAQKNKPETKLDFSDDLRNTFGEVYSNYQNALNDTVATVFTGDFDGLDGFEGDGKDFIMNKVLGDGKLLDLPQTVKDLNPLLESARLLTKQGFVIGSLKKGGYYISMRNDIDEEECKEREKAEWMYDRCCQIAKSDYEIETPAFEVQQRKYKIYPIEDKMYDEFIGKYKFNYKDAMENAIECAKSGGGDAPSSVTSIPAFDAPALPKCFVNLNNNDEDDMGDESDDAEDSFKNENGYVPGHCGVHIKQYKPDTDKNAFKIQATLKDSAGEVVRESEWEYLEPTMVVKGKESDEEAKLPYDFHMATGIKGLEDKNIQFWYSDKYWQSDHGGECKFGPYADWTREGDCGFPCSNPSDDPPAPAVKSEDHPLPTEFTYAGGWCTLHAEQDTAGGETWKISTKIYDDSKALVGYANKKYVDWDSTGSVKGTLPHALEITPTDDMVSFKYDGKEWDGDNDKPRAEDGHECGFGKWDGGRKLDCGFKC